MRQRVNTMRFSELARQIVHMGVGLGTVLLAWLSWPQAAACAAAAVVFNRVLLPRVAGGVLFRPDERPDGPPAGILLYPVSVLALILLFRERLDLAAAAWAILAFGDGAATLVGRTHGRHGRRWPWNPAKSLAGSAAFVLVAGPASVAAMLWVGHHLAVPPPLWLAVAAPLAGTIMAMFAETLPVRLDDNVTVPAAAAATLAWCTRIDPATFGANLPVMADRLPAALIVNGAVAAASRRAGAVSRSGVVAGLFVGLVIYMSGGPGAWILLFASFLVAAATSRLGLGRKRMLGIEQERGGQRGAAQVLANCGVATAAAVLVAGSATAPAASVALVAALVSGASDTAASEVGKAWGRATWTFPRLARVPPGTIGAVSIEGTAAGIATAAGLGALAVAVDLLPGSALWVVVAAAVVAMVVEGQLGARLEPRGVLNNDLLNFVQTGLAAALALAIWMPWLR